MADEQDQGDKPDDGAAKNDSSAPQDDKGGGDKGGGDKKDGGDGDEKPKRLRDRPGLLIGGTIVLILLIVGGVMYWLHERQFESTDDAYIDGHIVRLAPQVSGIVRQILVDDNMIVGPRQLLAVIDTAQPQARYQGLLAQAQQARANVTRSQAQVGVALQAVAQARANVREPQANLDKAEADLGRYNALLRIEPSAVAGQQLDAAIAAVRSTRAQRDAALKQVDQALAQLKSDRATIGADRAAVTAADAQSRAQEVDLINSRIISPIFGRIANRTVALGSYVQPGQQMMAIVPLHLWITANFKETQLKLMRVGQPVDIRIDTIPDVPFHGHVESFLRGAGQAFQLLPPENATGNFVKVVQRVAVRIAIDSPGIQAYPVGPGMSVVPTVKVR
ncbi:MAG: HlyD family secretion protein [Janthinobacterium lividum]